MGTSEKPTAPRGRLATIGRMLSSDALDTILSFVIGIGLVAYVVYGITSGQLTLGNGTLTLPGIHWPLQSFFRQQQVPILDGNPVRITRALVVQSLVEGIITLALGFILIGIGALISGIASASVARHEARGETPPALARFFTSWIGLLLQFGVGLALYGFADAIATNQAHSAGTLAALGALVGVIVSFVVKFGVVGLVAKGVASGAISGTAGHFVGKWWKRHDRDRARNAASD